jgi:capsular polysaccharide biosynthesis protein
MGIGAGMAVGLGAAVGREVLDSTLGTEEEVAAVLKLPVLAAITEIPAKQPRKWVALLGTGKTA